MFKGKKFIVFGEVIAVTTEAIVACLKASGVKEEDILLRSFDCLGWTDAGAMDPAHQKDLKAFADTYGRENLLVLLGFVDVDLIKIYALTLSVGDPSGMGSLSGVALRLPAYHMLEPEIKTQVPEDIYNEQVGMMEIAASEVMPEIIEILKKARNA